MEEDFRWHEEFRCFKPGILWPLEIPREVVLTEKKSQLSIFFFLLPATKILNLFKMFHFYHEIQIWFLAGKNFIVSSSVIITQVVFLQRTFSRLVFFSIFRSGPAKVFFFKFKFQFLTLSPSVVPNFLCSVRCISGKKASKKMHNNFVARDGNLWREKLSGKILLQHQKFFQLLS